MYCDYVFCTYAVKTLLLFYNYCLLEFSQVEQMLISPVMPMVSVYRLPLGQYSYSGHVINLPQDIAGFVTTLPRHANELDVIL